MSAGLGAERDRWGREDDPAAAIGRILDAAGEVFAEQGVTAAPMNAVAARAQCSRGTLYRYFPDGDALRLAFVTREAERLGARIAAGVRRTRRPDTRLVLGIELALAEVRADPILVAWFTASSAATATDIAIRSEAIVGLVDAFLLDLHERVTAGAGSVTLRPRQDWTRPAVRREAAAWIVRVILSLLTMPADDEHRLLERHLVPSLFH